MMYLRWFHLNQKRIVLSYEKVDRLMKRIIGTYIAESAHKPRVMEIARSSMQVVPSAVTMRHICVQAMSAELYPEQSFQSYTH